MRSAAASSSGADSRASIDGIVASQVEKLSEGRDILRRALEADLQKVNADRKAALTKA